MVFLLLTHIPFVTLILAIAIAIVRGMMIKERIRALDEAIRWTLLLPVGVAGIWGGIMHTFFGDLSAEFIGWANSPFQLEVGVANFGMGVAGVVGFWRKNDFGYWLATALLTTCFLWGAAIGHIHQMVSAHNYEPGNAGLIFYTDWAIPLLLWILLIAWSKAKRILISNLR